VESAVTDVAEVERGWIAFCEQLKTAGVEALQRWHGSPDASAEAAAETLIYMQRYLRMGLDWEVDNSSATHSRPVWLDRVSGGAGLYGPNLDNGYVFIRISGEHTYRLEIDTDSLDEINIAVHTARPAGGVPSIGNLNLKDLRIVDGKATVLFSATPQPGTWLQIPADAQMIFIRTYYADWTRCRNPGLRIECLSATDPLPAYRPPAQVIANLSQAVKFMESSLINGRKFLANFFKDVGVNEVRPAFTFVGSPDVIKYGGVHFQLQPDEALVLETEVPKSRYWSVQWQKWPWATPLDVMRHVISLNHEQARVDDDGKMRFILSRQDPGIQNWLSTGPRTEGFLMFRWIWSETNPLPRIRVVKFAEARALLPPNTPDFSPQERAGQLQRRREHLSQRY
jgi:hypothetical protein